MFSLFEVITISKGAWVHVKCIVMRQLVLRCTSTRWDYRIGAHLIVSHNLVYLNNIQIRRF